MLFLRVRQLQNLLEKIDEQGRFRGIDIYLGDTPGQAKTHGYSYVCMRTQYEELGQVMGFDKSNAKYALDHLGYILQEFFILSLL